MSGQRTDLVMRQLEGVRLSPCQKTAVARLAQDFGQDMPLADVAMAIYGRHADRWPAEWNASVRAMLGKVRRRVRPAGLLIVSGRGKRALWRLTWAVAP